jgi:hypothetical protein
LNSSDVADVVLTWPPNSSRFRLLAVTLLGISAAYGIAFVVVAVGRGWPGGFGDSFCLWSWGWFLTTHPAAEIYDPRLLRTAQVTLGMDPGASYPFAYPPTYLPVLALLGRFSGPVSFVVLMGATLPLYLWATVGNRWRSPALLAALAAPTTTLALVAGQSGFLASALLVGGLRLAPTSPVASGILFGLLTYKPQIGLLVPLALVVARAWRTIVTATVTALVLGLVTTLLYGLSIWLTWLASVPGFSRQVAAEGGQIEHLMPTVLIAIQHLGVPSPIDVLAQWTCTATVAITVGYLFSRGANPLAGAGLMTAVFLVTPYAFIYDMPIVATAIIWFVSERHRSGDVLDLSEILAIVLALLAPIVLNAGGSNIPLAPLSLALLLGLIARRCRRLQASATAPPSFNRAAEFS